MSSEVKMLDLTCDSCDATAKNIPEATAHVAANFGHEMTGPGPIEDSTISISLVPAGDEDDDDWDAADQ